MPAVVHFTRADEEAWLLMTAVPGKTAYQILEAYPERRTAVVDAIAAFLRQIHAIPTRECPFMSEHAYRLARARMRIDAGLVDADDFDDERQGWTAEQVPSQADQRQSSATETSQMGSNLEQAFALFGVSIEASWSEIEGARQKLVFQYRPGSGVEKEHAQVALKGIADAYVWLAKHMQSKR